MKERFEGEEGKRRLVEVLKDCPIVEHNEALALKLAELGELVSVEADKDLITEGGADNDVYFIIAGESEVFVKYRYVATRQSGDIVGEMAILEPSQPRSASVRAKTEVVALKVTEETFLQVAKEFNESNIWKAVARVNAERLRQRSELLSVPNTIPLLFLGCSVEGLTVAKEIQLGLKHEAVVVRIWTDRVFGPGGTAIDSLMDMVDAADFAVFIFGPDDKVTSRDEAYAAPRDNVVFELGLFMGKLDRNRTFIVREFNTNVKIPTDLLGVTEVTYVHHVGGSLSSEIGTVCTEIMDVVKALKVR